MRNIFIVAKYTFLEAYKSKIVIGTLGLGICLTTLVYIATEFTYGVPTKVGLDVGLAFLSISTNLIALFFGVSLISEEIEKRTVYTMITRPISRSNFLFGKILGLFGILTLNFLLLLFFTTIVFLKLGGSVNSLILAALFFSFLEAIFVLSLIVFFSLVTNKVLAVLMTFFIYVIGYSFQNIELLTQVKRNVSLQNSISFLKSFLPNLYKFNLRDIVFYESSISLDQFVGISLYGLTYIVLLTFASCMIFRKKELV